MKEFRIFERPSGKIKAVKKGWCWPAFIFDIFWMLFSIRLITIIIILISGAMGLILVSLLVTTGGMSTLAPEDVDVISSIAMIVIKIIFGFNGNLWREKNLISNGFDFMGTVTAASKGKAVDLFLFYHNKYTNSKV